MRGDGVLEFQEATEVVGNELTRTEAQLLHGECAKNGTSLLRHIYTLVT